MNDRFPCDDEHKPKKTLVDKMNEEYEKKFGKKCECNFYESFCRCKNKTKYNLTDENRERD